MVGDDEDEEDEDEDELSLLDEVEDDDDPLDEAEEAPFDELALFPLDFADEELSEPEFPLRA